MLAVLTVIITSTTALLGACLGAYLAHRSFRNERAFDRRIQWYEDTIQSISRVDDALTGCLSARQDNNHSEFSAAWNRMVQEKEELSNHTALRLIYARQDGYDALERVITETMLIPSLSFVDDDGNLNPKLDVVVKDYKNIFERLYYALASELREDLGWDPFRNRPHTAIFPESVKETEWWENHLGKTPAGGHAATPD